MWQHLVIDEVSAIGSSLVVHLRDRDGQGNVVQYRFHDTLERLRHHNTLLLWQSAMTPLTYVRSSADGVLLDDEDLFWRAFA